MTARAEFRSCVYRCVYALVLLTISVNIVNNILCYMEDQAGQRNMNEIERMKGETENRLHVQQNVLMNP